MTMGSRTAHAFREVKISGVRVGVVPSIFVELRFTVETARAERGCCCKQEFQITNYLLVCSATLVPDPPFSSKTRVCNSTLNKIFATAYNELRKLRTDGQSYADLLTWILRRRDGGSGRFPNDADFRESFETRDCYHLRPNYRQYLFDVLENGDSKDNRDIADKLASSDLTVEHIMPQTLNHAWEEELGPNFEEIHDVWEN